MRFVVCDWIWHGFDVLHRHLLLMMGFDCPLAFHHKKGEYIVVLRKHFVFVFRGRAFHFIGQSLQSCLDCIQVLHFVFYFFNSCYICFVLFGYSCQGEYIFFHLYVSCFNCLLIYVYEFFIDICLYCVLFEIKILFYLLVFSTHAVMHFV